MFKAGDAQLLALVQWLEDSQWLDPSVLRVGQLAQLSVLLPHFGKQSPWLQDRLKRHGQTALSVCSSWEAFAQLPITTRTHVRQAGAQMLSRTVPPAHQPVGAKTTSGSTGVAVTAHRTAVNQLFWLATTVREHLWHQRDPKGRLAIIRQSVTRAFDRSSWGAPIGNLFETGPSHGMPVTCSPQALIEWLKSVQPTYLLVYPSLWQSLLDHLHCPASEPVLANLAQVRTIGQTVSDALRDKTRQSLGITIADVYSSEEAGVIAIQCPTSGLYHTMAEGLIVEVLAPDGRACQAGEVGRVVVTDLLNFASPVIRYDLGDYAEVGPVCSCGRGLPTLKRILGRQRNMVKLPDGSSHWRLAGYPEFAGVANIQQYQLIQKSLSLIEVRLALANPPLTVGLEAALAAIISRTIKHEFEYRFVYFSGQVPQPQTGKFEEFVCEC